jgi:partner of Y14 and mago
MVLFLPSLMCTSASTSQRLPHSLRKEIKIRPGFTPQEDVTRFRGTRQKQQDLHALPKGHIIGWTPPATTTASKPSTAGTSKNAKKHAKRKEKRELQKATDDAETKVKDNWEDDDEDEGADGDAASTARKPSAQTREGQAAKPNEADALAEKLEKLDVQG